MITGINESKMLAKYISYEYNVNLNGKKCNSNQKQNNDKCQYECKTQRNIVSGIIWNPATCSSENG